MSTASIPAEFTLRASPFEGIGGMYATGEGEDKPLVVARLGLPNQLWVAADTKDDKGVAIHLKDGGLSWTFTKPEEPITLSSEPSLWHIRDAGVENGSKLVHIAAHTPKMVGATWYAAVDEDNKLYLQSIPVIPNAPPAPFWQMND